MNLVSLFNVEERLVKAETGPDFQPFKLEMQNQF